MTEEVKAIAVDKVEKISEILQNYLLEEKHIEGRLLSQGISKKKKNALRLLLKAIRSQRNEFVNIYLGNRSVHMWCALKHSLIELGNSLELLDREEDEIRFNKLCSNVNKLSSRVTMILKVVIEGGDIDDIS